MACSYPITLKRGNPILPTVELVPCGKCINCIQRKRAEWTFRLKQETKQHLFTSFLTLTYNDSNLPKNGKLQKKELQNYFKRVRTTEKNLKYYAIGEYGTKNKRPHYHAIVFSADNNILVDKWTKSNRGDSEPIGFVTTDKVTEASIHYVTGYLTDKYGEMDRKTGKQTNWSHSDLIPFSLMSKGLGKIYLKHATKFHKENFTTETITEGGKRTNLPRYYKDKIFDDKERKLLAYNNQQKYSQSSEDYEAEMSKRQYNKIIIQKQMQKKKI